MWGDVVQHVWHRQEKWYAFSNKTSEATRCKKSKHGAKTVLLMEATTGGPVTLRGKSASGSRLGNGVPEHVNLNRGIRNF